MTRCRGKVTAAVIVGNGPSACGMPAAFWRRAARRCLLVGTNRVLAMQGLADLPWDVLTIRDRYRSLWPAQSTGEAYHERLWKPHPAWKVGPAGDRSTFCGEYVHFAPGWQDRRPAPGEESRVMLASSVVLMAANWAWLQGARHLWLLGVDYRGGNVPMFRSFDVARATNYAQPVPPAVREEFAHARAAVRAGGGRLRNLSPESRLAEVPAADWREAFAAG